MRAIRSKLTYANVISTLCLFLLLGGGAALAAGKLAKNSVGTKQIKNNAVTAAKIKKGAITGAQIKSGSLTELRSMPQPWEWCPRHNRQKQLRLPKLRTA